MKKLWNIFRGFIIKVTKAYALCNICLDEGMVIYTDSGYWEIVQYGTFSLFAVHLDDSIESQPIDVFLSHVKDENVLAIYDNLVDCTMSTHPALYEI